MKKVQVVVLFGAGFIVGALTIGLWLSSAGHHQTATQAMTHDALIQQAISQLEQRKIGKDMLKDPQIRDVTVLYFKIKPGLNVQTILDSHTGEEISTEIGAVSNPFIRDYTSH